MGLLPWRSILSKLHPREQFDSLEEVQEFERRLTLEIDRGTVERIPVGKLFSYATPEEWYREKDSGVVYRYVPPEFPLKGHWLRVKNPEERSFFAQLYHGDAPTPEEYAALAAQLEDLWLRGEVERAPFLKTPIKGVMIYHHPPSDETFELTPPTPSTNRATWRRSSAPRKMGAGLET